VVFSMRGTGLTKKAPAAIGAKPTEVLGRVRSLLDSQTIRATEPRYPVDHPRWKSAGVGVFGISDFCHHVLAAAGRLKPQRTC
jgi:hypothetical protein